MYYQFEKLADSYSFQEFLVEVFNRKNNTQSFDEYKKKGAAQFGVDAYSPILKIALQAKKKELDRKGLVKELIRDLRKTVVDLEKFPHPVDHLFFITNTPKYSKVQDEVYALSIIRKFSITFYSWDELQKDISIYPDIRKRYYPHLYQTLFTEDVEFLKANIENINLQLQQEGYWTPQLKLFTETADPRINIFNYKTRFTDFIGRESEMSYLLDFLNDAAIFKWWMIEGPGGMGKSRLAMEFCYEAQKIGFYSGFLHTENIISDAGKPFKTGFPILIVIDYALANDESTIRLLTYLHEAILSKEARFPGTTHKVRVLLLDRIYKPEWFLKIADVITSCHYIVKNLDVPQPLKIQENNQDCSWQIILQVVEKTDPTKLAMIIAEKDNILETLFNIDHQKRPIYAFFAGEALVHNDSIRGWDVNQLLNFHLDRIERKIWSKNDGYKEFSEEFKHLLVINTLERSMSIEDIIFIVGHWGLSEKEQKKIIQLYTNLADIELVKKEEIVFYLPGDRSSNFNPIPVVKPGEYVLTKEYYGLLPDILGEFFMLKHFDKMLKEVPLGIDMPKLLDFAWNHNPYTVWWTLALLYQDFFVDRIRAEFEHLRQPLFYDNKEVINGAVAFNKARLFHSIGFYEGAKTHTLGDLNYLRKSRELTEKFPNRGDLIVEHAKILHNVSAFSEANTDLYLSELRELYKKSTQSAHVAVYYAQAIFNLTISLTTVEQTLLLMEKYWSDIVELNQKFDNNLDINLSVIKFISQLLRIKGAFEISYILDVFLPLMDKIFCKFSNSIEIAEALSIVSLNYTDIAAHLKLLDSLEHSINRFSLLFNFFKSNEFIAFRYAMAIRIFFENISEGYKEEKRLLYFENFKNLFERFSFNKEIAEYYIEVVFIMGNNYSKDSQLLKLNPKYLSDMTEIYKSQPSNIFIAECLAKFALNVSTWSINNQPNLSREIILPLLKELHESFPNHEIIAGPFANCLNTVTFLNDEDILQSERDYVPQLRYLHNKFSKNLEIATAFINQLLTISALLGKIDLQRVECVYLPEAISLQKNFPLNEYFATALSSLIINIANYKAGTAYMSQIRSLLLPLISDIQTSFYKSEALATKKIILLNLIINQKEVLPTDTLRELFIQDFESIHLQFKNNPNIGFIVLRELLALISPEFYEVFFDLQSEIESLLSNLFSVFSRNFQFVASFFQFILQQSRSDNVELILLSEKRFIQRLIMLQKGFVAQENLAFEFAEILFNWSLELDQSHNGYVFQQYLPIFEDLISKFPSSEIIAVNYSRVLVNLGLVSGDVTPKYNEDKYQSKLYWLCEKFPNSEELHINLFKNSINLISHYGVLDIEQSSAKFLGMGKIIYSSFYHSEKIANYYAELLFKLHLVGGKERVMFSMEVLLSIFEEIYENHFQSVHLAEILAKLNVNILTFLEENERDFIWFMIYNRELIERLHQQFSKNEVIAMSWAFTLQCHLLLCQTKEEAVSLKDWFELQQLAILFPGQQNIEEIKNFTWSYINQLGNER